MTLLGPSGAAGSSVPFCQSSAAKSRLSFLPPILFPSSLCTLHPSFPDLKSSPALQSSAPLPALLQQPSKEHHPVQHSPPYQMAPSFSDPSACFSTSAALCSLGAPDSAQALPCLHCLLGPTVHFIINGQLPHVSIPTRNLHLDAPKAPLT